MQTLILPALGVALMLFGTFLHPMHADPAVPAKAFAEYAQDRFWLAAHLVQFLGVAVLLISVLQLTGRLLRDGLVTALRTGTGTSLALAAALQAVDGVALKQMVDLWAAAELPEQDALLAAATAVRAVEIGFAAIFGMVLGLSLALLGVVLMRFPVGKPILGTLGVVGGLTAAAGGVLTGLYGFAPAPMLLNMAASLFLLGWYLIVVWQSPPQV